MDRNGYNASIIETEDGVCLLCGLCTDTARHEVFYGPGTRTLSKKYGLWVNLCPNCHAKVHRDKQGEANKALQELARDAFIRNGHTDAEFRRIFVTGDVKWWEV